MHLCLQWFVWDDDHLNPKVDSPLFAATVAAAAPLQHCQVDLVHQLLGLKALGGLIVWKEYHWNILDRQYRC